MPAEGTQERGVLHPLGFWSARRAPKPPQPLGPGSSPWLRPLSQSLALHGDLSSACGTQGGSARSRSLVGGWLLWN